MKKTSSFLRFCGAIPVGCLTALTFCVIAILTLMPSNSVPSVSIPHIDKVVHALMFGALATVALYDCARYNGRLSVQEWIVCAVIASAIGGVIELVQQAMGFGRSAEFADFVADTIGSFIVPLIFWKLINEIVEFNALTLCTLRHGSPIPEKLLNLYLESFPPEERRSVESIADLMSAKGSPYNFTVIKYGKRTIGFISWWRLKGFVYVEHFAIDPRERSHGFGAKSMERFCEMHRGSTVVLEVEPDGSTPMASRRIAFYERCGFNSHTGFDYMQPPYSPGLSSVPLMLMSWGIAPELDSVAAEIHTRVYGA